MLSILTSSLAFLLPLAGITQLLLAAGSLAIPRVMGWREQLAGIPAIFRQMFWVYAAYIWVFNLGFVLVSLLAPRQLLNGSFLAVALTGTIGVYWGARVAIQWAVFAREDLARSPFEKGALVVLETGFVAWTVVYLACASINFMHFVDAP